MVAEVARSPELGEVVETMVGTPKRERGMVMLRRAIERGELPPDTDLELALDLIAAPVYWRLVVRAAEAGPGYLDRLTDMLCHAIGGGAAPDRRRPPRRAGDQPCGGGATVPSSEWEHGSRIWRS
ncbi:TetR-like C-terminal domain-containing protein [Thermocatellispora tengchongensis]|uniref:TetR-like C-terminal domain-containing protein n=1 Tax=Thermocatellispora tengchongensis TaxID=1073253 RepID=UPI0036438CA1